MAVLKATGVNCWGKREVIGVSCRLSEAEVHWREFLQQLQKRGLEGVQLIVSDDHSGLRAARRAVFPSVPWQRCQFHLSQNAQRYARRSDQRAAIATDIRDIFNAPSEAKLRRCFGPESSNTTTATRSWPIGWRPICRKALRSFVLHVLPGGAFAPTTGWRPKPSDSPAYPGRRYLSKHRVRTTTHHRCRRGDSRRLADRETVPQSGRFQTTGESDLRSLSVKYRKTVA